LHQHFTSSFWANILSPKKLQSQSVARKKLLKALLYEKGESKMLMKWIPGVNFTNILGAAFMYADSKSAKNTDGLTVFFAPLGSAHVNVGEIDPQSTKPLI